MYLFLEEELSVLHVSKKHITELSANILKIFFKHNSYSCRTLVNEHVPCQKGRCKVSILLAYKVQAQFRCSTQSWNEMTSCINLLFVVCCLLLVRFRTSSIFDAAVDPIQLKNVTFEHVKGVRSKIKCV